MKLLYHESINTLPIANYEEVKKTENLSYLYDLKFLDCKNKPAKPELLQAWEKIEDEYTEIISKRRTSVDMIEKRAELGFLVSQELNVKLICFQLSNGSFDEKYIEILEDAGYIFNENGDHKEQAQSIRHRSDNLITQITMLTDEIEKMSIIGSTVELEKMKGMFRQHLQLGDINIYTTTVKEWLYYENDLIAYFDKKSLHK